MQGHLRDVLGQDERSAEQLRRTSVMLLSRSLARCGAGRRPERAGGRLRDSRAHGWQEEKTQRSRTGCGRPHGRGAGLSTELGPATAGLTAAQEEEARPAGPALPEAPVTSTRGRCPTLRVARGVTGCRGRPPDPGAQGPPSLHTEHTSLSYYQIHFTVKTKSPDTLVKQRSLRHPSRDTHSRPKLPGCGSAALGCRRERRGSW